MSRLEGKVALITGAARGMGAAEARLFVAEGARVVITDVLDVEGKVLAEDLGPSAMYVHLDVTDEHEWNVARAVAERTYGRLSVLVNNAGILHYGSLAETSKDDFERVLAVNLVGPFLGMKVVGGAMAAGGGGSIVNVSSTGGLIGYSTLGAYVASKWGLRGLTKTAAIEFGHAGVRVNSIHPGGVRTPMTDPDGTGATVRPEMFAQQPIPRIGAPEEVANLALFLASDESSYCTGAEFVVDGGSTAGQDLAAAASVAP
ncbi:MAG TPA: glucose 1-dehydrogenase [Actinomycetes bacterium]|nr:glucose 1-dehydrogenase [Actinomycetes bacterium]